MSEVYAEKYIGVRTDWSVLCIGIPGHLKDVWHHFMNTFFLLLVEASRSIRQIIIPWCIIKNVVMKLFRNQVASSRLLLRLATTLTLPPTLLGLSIPLQCQGRGEDKK